MPKNEMPIDKVLNVFEGIPKTKLQGSDAQSIKTLQSGNVP